MSKMTDPLRAVPTDPAYGLTVPVRYVENHDGDTITVMLRTGQRMIVRLGEEIGMLDAPELNEAEGKRVRNWVRGYLEEAEINHIPIKVWIPLPKAGKDGVVDITDILQLTKFHRVNARIYVGGRDLISIVSAYMSNIGLK